MKTFKPSNFCGIVCLDISDGLVVLPGLNIICVGEEHSLTMNNRSGCKCKTSFCAYTACRKSRSTKETRHYFAYLYNSQDKATDTTKPVCKRCFKPLET